MLRTMFPVCASFGPIFIALGCLFPHREGFSWGFLISAPGALMTAMALSFLFQRLNALEKTDAKSPCSEV